MSGRISVLHVVEDRESPDGALAEVSDGLDVERVSSGEAVRKRLDRGLVDCVVSDGADAEVLGALGSVDADVPVLCLTDGGRESRPDAAEAELVHRVDVGADATGSGRLAERIEDVAGGGERARTRTDGGTSKASGELLASLPDAAIAIGASGEVRDANDAAVEVFGTEPLVGRGIEDVVADGSLDDGFLAGHRAANRQIRDGAGDARFQFQATGDDEARTYEVRYARRIDGGEFDGVVGSLRDVTDLVDPASTPVRERYGSLIDTIPDTVALIDLEGNFIDVHNFEGWSGYTEEELAGEHVSIAVPETYVEKGNEIVGELLSESDEEKATYEMEIETKYGERIPFENHVTLLPPDEDGTVHGSMSILRDISDRRAHERQLEALNDAMRELVGAESPEGVADLLATTVEGLSRFDRATLALADDADASLEPVTVGDQVDDPPGDGATLEPGSPAWTAYEGGNVETATDGGAHPDSAVESALACPLGEHGVLVLGSRIPGTFEGNDHSIAEILAGGVEAALDRIEHLDALSDREQELEAYETAVEATDDSIAVLNQDVEYVMANERFLETTKRAEEELIGQPAEAGINEELVVESPPDEEIEATWAEAVEEAMEHGSGNARYETKMILEHGIATVESRVTAVVQDDDSLVFVLSTRDVTERKEREERIERLHESSRDLMAAESKQAVAEEVVSAVENTLGFPANVVRMVDESGEYLEPVAVADSARDLLGDRAPIVIEDDQLGEAFESGEPIVIDDVQQYTDAYEDSDVHSLLSLPIGEYGLLSIVDEEIGAYDESDLRIAEILTSNAEAAFDRVEKEEALREREAELSRQIDRLDQFARIVSHDLRNPINVAQGHLEFLAEKIEDGEHVAEIEGAHERMLAIIEDVLTLAREGDEATDVEPVDLATIADDCWGNVDTRDATIEVETDLTVVADDGRMQQLLENLFRNGIDHVGDDVTIRVGAVDGGFYVEDDGPGIPEDERDRVFESGYSTRQSGTGFGLNIVRTIAEAHDWEVRATEGGDGGARFEFTGVEIA